jgi:hypothetical protein
LWRIKIIKKHHNIIIGMCIILLNSYVKCVCGWDIFNDVINISSYQAVRQECNAKNVSITLIVGMDIWCKLAHCPLETLLVSIQNKLVANVDLILETYTGHWYRPHPISIHHQHHHHQPIDVPTAGAQAFLWITHKENGP